MSIRSPRSRRRGFTRLLVLMAVVAFTAATVVVLPDTGIWSNFLRRRERRARIDRDLREILTVAESIRAEKGRYPGSIEEMLCYPEDPNTFIICVTPPRDPWKHEYRYEIAGGRPRVACLGSDAQPGGEGEAADTVLPERQPQQEPQRQPQPNPNPSPIPNRIPSPSPNRNPIPIPGERQG